MTEEAADSTPLIDLDGAIMTQEDLEAMEKTDFSLEEATAFKGVYNHYDYTFGKGDGNCSVALVKSMVRALGVKMDKDSETELGTMLEECDDNGDGNTQFPEFLVLINKMTAMNFCGMNDAAAQRVAEAEQAAVHAAKVESKKNARREEERMQASKNMQDFISSSISLSKENVNSKNTTSKRSSEYLGEQKEMMGIIAGKGGDAEKAEPASATSA